MLSKKLFHMHIEIEKLKKESFVNSGFRESMLEQEKMVYHTHNLWEC